MEYNNLHPPTKKAMAYILAGWWTEADQLALLGAKVGH